MVTKEEAVMRDKKLSPLMFVGTGSDVGKSIVAAGFCRIFKQDGYTPAPFKAQNMALNSYATPDGLEIGRAQATQAEAAMIPCSTDMNPLLLKPNSNHTSQIVLHGRPRGNQSAYDYFKKEGKEELREEVHKAFDRLESRYNPIVMEGAGSVAEVNLRDSDIVNISMAIYANANVILVADIERGGVFASLYGSIMLLTPQERSYIKGIIINKFRGDSRLFIEGRKIIEQLCGVPVLGVLPYFKDIYIEEEDSVALENKSITALANTYGKINIVVVLLRHISNYTDFNILEQDSRVHLFYSNNVSEIKKADIIIIPGSKSTLSDLYEMRRSGVASAVISAYKEGKSVMGICGGFQIMGEEVLDPNHIEGDIERLPGLGLLPITTTITEEKITKQVEFILNCGVTGVVAQGAEGGVAADEVSEVIGVGGSLMKGYEIHMGSSAITSERGGYLNIIKDDVGERYDGCYVNERCFGTYIHGILDNKEFIDFLLKRHNEKLSNSTFNYAEFKEQQYNRLAQLIREHVDIEAIYKIMKS